MTNKFTLQESPNFVGAYIVVNNETGEATPCRDLRNALAHIKDQESPQSVVVTEPKQMTLEEFFGCLTGGMGYTPAITWTLTGRVERVHNWATARSIAQDFPKKQY